MLGRAYAELTQHYPAPGWVEHDADEIWSTSLRVMQQALAASGLPPGGLAAIGITNQRETTVLWDRRTGDPVHRAIVWQSRQTARASASACAPPATSRCCARAPDSCSTRTSPPARSAGCSSGDPLLRARAANGELAFGTVDSWLVHRLTGGRVHATDPTNASRTLLFDIERRCWDEELCAVFGVPPVRAAAGAPEFRRPRRDHDARRHRRGSADRRHRRRPAGGALRPGLRRAGHGEEHLRHRRLPGAEHRRAARGQPPGPAHDPVLRRAWRDRLRARGLRVRRRRGGAVAARRARPRHIRGRDRAAGRERPGRERRLPGAGLRRSRRTVLGCRSPRARSSD